MIRTRSRSPRFTLALAFVLVAMGLALASGCGGGGSKPVEPEVPVPPTPNTPVNAVRLLEWCWDHRDAAKYHEVFTNDFEYDFAPSDSEGVATINRNEELQIGTSLFGAAQSVVMQLNSTLLAVPDGRPGKDPRYHKEIATTVLLSVNQPAPAKDYSTSGTTRFYLTRGDVAQIPQELLDRGFTADSTRWYVDHWSDTSPDCGAGKVCVTVGRIKVDFASGPVGARRAAN